MLDPQGWKNPCLEKAGFRVLMVALWGVTHDVQQLLAEGLGLPLLHVRDLLQIFDLLRLADGDVAEQRLVEQQRWIEFQFGGYAVSPFA